MIFHITNHITCFSTHAEHFPLTRPLVVDQFTCFYNSESSHLIIEPAHLEGKRRYSSLFALCSALVSPLCLLPTIKDQLLGVLHKALRLQALNLLSLSLLRLMTFSKSLCGLILKESITRL